MKHKILSIKIIWKTKNIQQYRYKPHSQPENKYKKYSTNLLFMSAPT